jgi:hypothetical protein
VVFGWVLELRYEALASVICFFGKILSWETLCPGAYYGVVVGLVLESLWLNLRLEFVSEM